MGANVDPPTDRRFDRMACILQFVADLGRLRRSSCSGKLSTLDKPILSFQLRHVLDFGVDQGYRIKVAWSGDENHTPQNVDFLDRELPDKGQHQFEECDDPD